MSKERHPYKFSPLQEKLTIIAMVIIGVVAVLNVLFKVTTPYVMIPMIILAVAVYIASLVAGKMKK
ncbi:MAG: hypothetical protein GX138_01600 [Firmicutes bacterium]|jgi:membrane protein YdbS with pleckstrin-like domain|nr:hypothetical protein [Bacillota bacterium]